MTRKSHSTQTEVSDLSQDWPVKDFQPINYDYTGSPVNVTVPQGMQGVLFAAIGGSGGNTTTRGLLPNLGGKGANVGGYTLVKQGDTLTVLWTGDHGSHLRMLLAIDSGVPTIHELAVRSGSNPWSVAAGDPTQARLSIVFLNLRYTLPGAAPATGDLPK